MGGFDYEEARLDIIDNGGDPDYLDEYNTKKRDEYLREMGLRPEDYGAKRESDRGSSDRSDHSGTEGCFLTSACIRARNLPDDCPELTTLRACRDGYLAALPGGPEEIRQYYRIAPQIVSRIEARPDAKAVWERVYQEMILPCVRLIREGREAQALSLYKAYTLKLSEEA